MDENPEPQKKFRYIFSHLSPHWAQKRKGSSQSSPFLLF
jgi:hypothetical protein